MFCKNCGKEVANNVVICNSCGVAVKAPSNIWHFKNALLGFGMWFLGLIGNTLLMVSFIKPGADQQQISKIGSIGGLSLFVLTFFILFFMSKRVQKKTLKLT